ncbi:MAG: hypothetical protein ACXWTX_05645 [Gallionella sp.]
MKIFLITLSVAATLSMSACGSGGGNGSSPPPQTSNFSSSRLAAEQQGVIPALDRTTSLLGTDADGNGVRDDIDTYINSLPDTLIQKKALKQTAAYFNLAMAVNLTNPAAIDAVSVQAANSSSCNQIVYGDAAWVKTKVILKYVVNTKERFTAYMKYNQALSGKMLYVAPKGVGCAP